MKNSSTKSGKKRNNRSTSKKAEADNVKDFKNKDLIDDLENSDDLNEDMDAAAADENVKDSPKKSKSRVRKSKSSKSKKDETNLDEDEDLNSDSKFMDDDEELDGKKTKSSDSAKDNYDYETTEGYLDNDYDDDDDNEESDDEEEDSDEDNEEDSDEDDDDDSDDEDEDEEEDEADDDEDSDEEDDDSDDDADDEEEAVPSPTLITRIKNAFVKETGDDSKNLFKKFLNIFKKGNAVGEIDDEEKKESFQARFKDSMAKFADKFSSMLHFNKKSKSKGRKSSSSKKRRKH